MDIREYIEVVEGIRKLFHNPKTRESSTTIISAYTLIGLGRQEGFLESRDKKILDREVYKTFEETIEDAVREDRKFTQQHIRQAIKVMNHLVRDLAA